MNVRPLLPGELSEVFLLTLGHGLSSGTGELGRNTSHHWTSHLTGQEYSRITSEKSDRRLDPDREIVSYSTEKEKSDLSVKSGMKLKSKAQ